MPDLDSHLRHTAAPEHRRGAAAVVASCAVVVLLLLAALLTGLLALLFAASVLLTATIVALHVQGMRTARRTATWMRFEQDFWRYVESSRRPRRRGSR